MSDNAARNPHATGEHVCSCGEAHGSFYTAGYEAAEAKYKAALEAAEAERDGLKTLLLDVAASSVALDDPCKGYVDVQVDRGIWDALQAGKKGQQVATPEPEPCEECGGAGRINMAIPMHYSDPTYEGPKRWCVCPTCGGSRRKPTNESEES